MLRRPPIVALLVAEVISMTGSMMSAVALPWFVLVTAGSASRAAYVVGAQVLAYAVLGIPAGSVSARLGARRTMLACDLGRAPVVALIPALYLQGLLSFPVLLVLSFATGALSTPYTSAQQFVLPELLGEDQRLIAEANAVFQSASRLTYLLGPALAGFLIGFLGAKNVLLVDAGTYVASFLLVGAFIPSVARPPAEPDLGGLFGGLRFLWRDRLLRTLTVASIGSQMAFQALTLALPVLAFERYDHNARLAGLFLATWGGGAVAGSVIAYRIVRRFDPLVLGSVAWLGYALPLWLLVPRLPAAAVFAPLALAGIGNGVRNPPLASLRILRVPASLRPQTLTASGTLAWLGGAVALAGIGAALRALGLTSVFALIAAVSTTTALAFAVSARAIRRDA
jgi:MFS family permease